MKNKKQPILQYLTSELAQLKQNGLYKQERVITSPQQSDITVSTGAHVINFCANNYLGLADNPELIQTAQQALTDFGFGLASVRFICGTQSIHKALEQAVSQFLGTEDCILYSSCFDANGGLFECLLNEQDAIISDELNHASIIDGIRLCKAKRFRYKNNNMDSLRAELTAARDSGARFMLVVTDGVFSMDGYIANLPAICDLAEEFGALVMVDDSHAVGFMGDHGRGTPEHWHVLDRIDIMTGTFGKALGGASGGYTAAKKPIIEWLRNRSRPYLFSNTLAPVITATTLKVLSLIQGTLGQQLRNTLKQNATHFREGMTRLGFTLLPGEHPIIPVMLGDAKLATQMADALLKEGIYVIGFSYPVVPLNQARIRVQISARHTPSQIDRAIDAFARVGKQLGVIS